MSWISFDYVCDNEDCAQKGETKLRDHPRGEVQCCELCDIEMRRLPPTGMRTPHVSWSTWRVSV